jgi:putative transposase
MPMNERHIRGILKEFVGYYNRGRPHSSLGPGIPEPNQAEVPASGDRHQLPVGYRIKSRSVLGGLHHILSCTKVAAMASRSFSI